MGLLAGCGGGGGGSGKVRLNNDLNDPVIGVFGEAGKFSMTPEEANAANGATPPPAMSPAVTTTNHYFRLEFPFPVTAANLLLDDPLLEPFSFLNGNITVTDSSGNHVPGIAMVDGIDAQGNDRSGDAGFPSEVDSSGRDRNLSYVDDDGKELHVFLFVADTDGDLSTIAAFNAVGAAETTVSTLDSVRITLKTVANVFFDGSWKIDIGLGLPVDSTVPQVLRVRRELADSGDPDNAAAASPFSTFRVDFDEPVVPQSVGRSAALNGFPFDGNRPLPPIGPPLPNTILTATVNAGVETLYLAFDCNPVGPNNLTSYRLTPLTMLPTNTSVRIQLHSLTTNTASFIDLSANAYDGQNGDTLDFVADFLIGAGPALVNVPVSPEVSYWLPVRGPGIGAIDLNGWGFTTNTPGSATVARPAIVTTSASLNLQFAIATIGYPDGVPHNNFAHPVGLGAKYGPGDRDWVDTQGDPGNPGTPLPGVNEGSSGFETLCRNSAGEVILTGQDFSQVGPIQDVQIGEFLDLLYHDTQNFYADEAFHITRPGMTANGGALPTLGRNVISEPPAPNPPPLRYWIGLVPIDIVVDSANPNVSPFLIESDEVWTGTRHPLGCQQFRPNTINPFGPDQSLFPHTGIGPTVQSATVSAGTYSARQQIGNFLYVTDSQNQVVHALNSNNMSVIASIPLPDPRGLGISPNNKLLYVSNSADDSLSVVDVDPTSTTFHTEIARLPVGAGPRSVTVQPDNEDIFVANFTGNSITIIDQQTLTVRKTIDALVSSPYDITSTPRQLQPTSPNPFGWACGIYFAYISNFGGNNVLVFESGPDGPQGIGYDNILGSVPTGDNPFDVVEPRGICQSPFTNPQGLYAGGVFVAHRDSQGFGVVSHIQFTNQAIYGPLPRQAPPGFFIPPGFLDRNFEITGQWGITDDTRLTGRSPLTVSLADGAFLTYHQNPSGILNFSTGYLPPNPEQTGFINSHHSMRLVPGAAIPAWLPDRLYVGYADTDAIDVLNPQNPALVEGTIPADHGLGTREIVSYWDD